MKMKVVVLVALIVAFLACANAAATFTANPGAIAIAGNSYAITRHVGGDPTAAFSAAFTIDVTCGATEDCAANSATWTPTSITGVTVNVVAAAPDTVTITPSAGCPDRFKLTFTAPNATVGGPSYVRDLIVFVTDATLYTGVPSIATSWLATLVTNTPSRNLQWSPSSAPDFSAAPYSFVDPAASAIPLYWGNFYEIRLGLYDTTNYCGSNGTWPDNTNGNDVAPTPANNGWDLRGCENFIEAGDTWTFPAPSQRIPRTGSDGYDTIRPQSAANPIAATGGPLVWSVRGAPTQSSLSFVGLARPSTWVANCVDAINGATNPNFPCITPRFNPDPQVWVISATGTQPARISAIGTSSVTNPTVTLNQQATPPVVLSQMQATNEFLVTFEWPNIQTAITADAAAGIPAQPIVISRPTCASSGAFVADDGTATTVKGINFFPTCDQGLMTSSGCTPSATLLNCLNSTDVANDADTVVNSLIGTDPLVGVWLSQRPLQVLPNGAAAAVLNKGDGSATSVALSFDSRQGTLPFTIGFPLDKDLDGRTGTTIIQNYWNFGANGTTNPGVVTIRPRAVIECANTGDCLTTTGGVSNYVSGNLASFFGAGGVPTLTVSNANPTATLAFASLPQPTEGNTWLMFFEVQDAVTSATVYPYSSMPYLTITLTDIDITFVNFPPDDSNFYITQPQASAPGSYVYQVRIKRSPRSLGLASITLGWTIEGAANPIQFVVNGTVVSSFVFTEYQTVINFQIYTANAPVGPFTITWTDPLAANNGNSFLQIPAPATNLFVRANPISVKTVATTRVQGPFVGEPFFVELTWSPPATAAFSVIGSGGSINEGSVTATAAAGDTGMILGPLTPILPSNIALSSPSFQLPIALRVTDTTSYSVVSVVTVTVYRHSFVVTNAVSNGDTQTNTLNLFTNGEASQQYCISTNYPVFNSSLVTAADSVSISFASVASAPNVPGLIFTPSAVVLSQASPRACVTIRADRTFNWDSIITTGAALSYTVNTYLGGSLAGMFQNPTGAPIPGTESIWDFPHSVSVTRLSSALKVALDDSRLTGVASTYALGETVQVRVYTDVLPVAGLNYTIRASGGVSIVPSTAGSSSTSSHGRFAPATAGAPGQWQAWDVTFNGFAGDSEASAASFARQVTFTLYVSSGDAEFYRSTNPSALLDAVASVTTVSVVKRGVTITLSDDEVQLTSLVSGSVTGLVKLSHPVVNGLNVSLMARTTNGVASGGLSFSPASLQFTAGGANSQAFTVSGNLLGDYEVVGFLSGADADWFNLNDALSAYQTITVTKRTGPAFLTTTLDAQGAINAGVTYGPVGVSFPSPLQLGESVTITPTGSDFTFTPASVTLTAGQSKALFSFVFRSATGVNTGVVFWQFTGPDAWKYDYLSSGALRQEYTISYKSLSITYQSRTNIIPGVTHEGYVTLPFAVASDLTITPLAIGSSISFSPASWVFSPATGNVLHFTYTLSGTQAFGLSSNADVFQPSTGNVAINIVYLFNGTDSAVFAAPTLPDTLFISRPAFKLDATYQVSDVVQNAAEQPLLNTPGTSGNLFVIGKWSQMYTVHLAAPPAAGSVTLTISDSQNVVEFEVDSAAAASSSAVLTFNADSYTQYFRFRFVKLLSADATAIGIVRLSTAVTGTNAAWYDFTEIQNAFESIKVVPALAFSPIPAVYTDGGVENLFVALKSANGAIGGSWPFADDAQFTLHIIPSLKSGVVIEPSTLEFSKSQASDPVQSFSIRHSNPRVFSGSRFYTLTYLVRFAGATGTTDITSIVPQDAQNVLLSRYQIIPKFPHVLSYGWQKASFNLSHIPVAHVSFIPRLPAIDGSNNVRGATTPAGRVDFEPAVIVASPGQQVVEFHVKAQPGVDRDNLYYRVDWEVVGHLDDTVNWVESLQVNGNGLNNNPAGGGNGLYFATWHLASAGVTTLSFAALFGACIIALLNML